jgi:hypothetical protein
MPRFFAFTAPLAALLLLVGCGDNGSARLETSAASSAATVSGVDIAGNVSAGIGSDSVLVFAMAAPEPGAAPKPISVGVVGDDGVFELSGIPPGTYGLLFLDDKANDGVVDPGDPVAALVDANQQLQDLAAGDRVGLTNIQLDFRRSQALAESIDVAHSGPTEPLPTPTPLPNAS